MSERGCIPDGYIGDDVDNTSSHNHGEWVEGGTSQSWVHTMIPDIGVVALEEPHEHGNHSVGETDECGDVDGESEWLPGRQVVVEEKKSKFNRKNSNRIECHSHKVGGLAVSGLVVGLIAVRRPYSGCLFLINGKCTPSNNDNICKDSKPVKRLDTAENGDTRPDSKSNNKGRENGEDDEDWDDRICRSGMFENINPAAEHWNSLVQRFQLGVHKVEIALVPTGEFHNIRISRIWIEAKEVTECKHNLFALFVPPCRWCYTRQIEADSIGSGNLVLSEVGRRHLEIRRRMTKDSAATRRI